MSNTTANGGGCTCGAVRYQMEAAPLFVNCCHCSWCQRETGSAFAVNAMIETARLTVLQGSPVTVLTPSASGKGQKVLRCPNCQVALWSHYAGSGDFISFVRVGTLDHPEKFPPDAHIFTSTRLPWVTLPEGALVATEYYDARTVWPAETMQRYKDARAHARGTAGS